jgi:cytochrome c-550 PedF
MSLRNLIISPKTLRRSLAAALLCGGVVLSGQVLAHGNVTPQAVDISGLPKLGEEWESENPYRGNARAVEVGSSAYNQNCARCHGLEVISGGIAPDLRNLDLGDEGDSWFIMRMQNGSVRNGVTYMPVFDGVLSREAMWSIRTYIETQHVD